MKEKIRGRSQKTAIWQGNRHIGPVEKQVLGRLIKQEMVEEAAQIVGKEMKTAHGKDEGMSRLLGRLGMERRVHEEQRKVIWDLAIKAGLTPGEVSGVLRSWGVIAS